MSSSSVSAGVNTIDKSNVLWRVFDFEPRILAQSNGSTQIYLSGGIGELSSLALIVELPERLAKPVPDGIKSNSSNHSLKSETSRRVNVAVDLPSTSSGKTKFTRLG